MDSVMTIDSNGVKRWRNSDNRLHRLDGPAVIWPNGMIGYYINGRHHREDGPATITADGRGYWYYKGYARTFDYWVSLVKISPELELELRLKYS